MKTTSYKSIIWQSNTALRLLLFFLENPGREFYEKQVKEKTGLSLGATNKYLAGLAEEDFLVLKRQGKMKFFKLNRESLIVKYLKIIHSLSLPVIASLRDLGKKLGAKLYLYGSVARGEDDEDSDLDVLVLGDVKLENLEKEILPIRKRFGKNIKLAIFKRNEWIKMAEKDPAFYERVEKDKIELI